MPLTHENRFDGNFSNNNDQSYLHKKFKKMASAMSVLSSGQPKGGDNRLVESNVTLSTCNTHIPNGSIAAAHPEIEKIKEKPKAIGKDAENNVQTNFKKDSSRFSDVNNIVQVAGQTRINDEFLNKTENLENDFIADSINAGAGGRYICPYCKLSCAKPSVLQKHIRAHTNERPYPCVPCGFAFKTKSNLYKHRRSRTHALRLQGADITSVNDDDLSGGSESDTSIPPSSMSDTGSEPCVIRFENSRPNEFSSPELTSDSATPMINTNTSSNDNGKSKYIYKPKFRAAMYQATDDKDKLKRNFSQNAELLTEHISKIISDNEAIVDVIDTPLQKKYGKIKQIAESKQFLNDTSESKQESTPLNLTKSNSDAENSFRKRSYSETFTHIDYHKHPLNPEGSIIKDLLLKTKANGLLPIMGENADSVGPLFVCPLCQIIYRSAENLEVHRMYYCKGSVANNTALVSNVQKESGKLPRPENMFVRSNSVNVRLPESSSAFSKLNKSPPLKRKPENLEIIKPETNDIVAPLPSPGPLLGNTRLVDTRVSLDMNRKSENIKVKPSISPKRRLDNRTDTYSPRSTENISPRSSDMYPQSKIRYIDVDAATLRSIEELSPHTRHNTTSLQMFGGEVKIVDHSGGTTTLRIEPSKNQLSPILIQQNLSPSKLPNDTEASSVVVRSGLHSGGTIVHNPPTPKEILTTPQPKAPRISIANAQAMPNIADMPRFQFPPLSAITAYNPLTLPPLSPSSSPSGPSTILHGGKLIPHVPGMPGPNTPGTFIESSKLQQKENVQASLLQNSKGNSASKYDSFRNARSPVRSLHIETVKQSKDTNLEIESPQYLSTVPLIKIKNVDDSNILPKIYSNNIIKPVIGRSDHATKRNFEGMPKTTTLKETTTLSVGKAKTILNVTSSKNIEIKNDDMKSFNFENFITKAEIYNSQIPSSAEVQKNSNAQETPVTLNQNERSETLYFQKSNSSKTAIEEKKPKFLRPSTLPLKPGTFTPKRHHGITPNANTMPLVSPETPRPAKAYGQLYLNGNAYTYLGLKCSTKVFYCTINRPQPTYVPNQHFLSMYSNWQLLSELTPDPLGLSTSSAMSLYDSRHRPQNVAVAVIKQDLILTHSSQWNKNFKDSKQITAANDLKFSEDKVHCQDNLPKKELTGGFESNEEYTYVRGRGRGRYVCSECGIRCKKPSMLKKHIRTHTDVRPYTCVHCAFSFKTKGNLTKHMKSKAHYKKCCELGINPNDGNDTENGEMLQSGETDDDTDTDGDEGNEGETESSDTEVSKSRLPEHEAAHCLLSLGGTRPAASATPGLITSARPTTYPYTPAALENCNLDISSENLQISRSSSVDSRLNSDNEPMDLSKSDVKPSTNMTEIPTARESTVLASLASNTAKLPQPQTQWPNGEPMLHTYLTERALLDSKIKQSQLMSNVSKSGNIELDKPLFEENVSNGVSSLTKSKIKISSAVLTSNIVEGLIQLPNDSDKTTDTVPICKENAIFVKEIPVSLVTNTEPRPNRNQSSSNAENAKHVVSEYLRHARINLIKSQDDNILLHNENMSENKSSKGYIDENSKDESLAADQDSTKLPSLEIDTVARKVVIGVGGVSFKVSKEKEFENNYLPGKLMEDGRRVCDFCNKTFTKHSQLRLHLNIHYMERPFRCGVCAVSFRTRGHLQKHERSGSHHNKVSMTSTFGAATSFNPRPFRCSDCNIAFRIHGHLAKHLRSKMHVMRLECLFKLPFGTFTEIERAGVSLTDIDTTDCASSLTSLQSLARKLHEKDPTKLEYRESTASRSSNRESSEDEDLHVAAENTYDSEKDNNEAKNLDCSENKTKETS